MCLQLLLQLCLVHAWLKSTNAFAAAAFWLVFELLLQAFRHTTPLAYAYYFSSLYDA